MPEGGRRRTVIIPEGHVPTADTMTLPTPPSLDNDDGDDVGNGNINNSKMIMKSGGVLSPSSTSAAPQRRATLAQSALTAGQPTQRVTAAPRAGAASRFECLKRNTCLSKEEHARVLEVFRANDGNLCTEQQIQAALSHLGLVCTRSELLGHLAAVRFFPGLTVDSLSQDTFKELVEKLKLEFRLEQYAAETPNPNPSNGAPGVGTDRSATNRMSAMNSFFSSSGGGGGAADLQLIDAFVAMGGHRDRTGTVPLRPLSVAIESFGLDVDIDTALTRVLGEQRVGKKPRASRGTVTMANSTNSGSTRPMLETLDASRLSDDTDGQERPPPPPIVLDFSEFVRLFDHIRQQANAAERLAALSRRPTASPRMTPSAGGRSSLSVDPSCFVQHTSPGRQLTPESGDLLLNANASISAPTFDLLARTESTSAYSDDQTVSGGLYGGAETDENENDYDDDDFDMIDDDREFGEFSGGLYGMSPSSRRPTGASVSLAMPSEYDGPSGAIRRKLDILVRNAQSTCLGRKSSFLSPGTQHHRRHSAAGLKPMPKEHLVLNGDGTFSQKIRDTTKFMRSTAMVNRLLGRTEDNYSPTSSPLLLKMKGSKQQQHHQGGKKQPAGTPRFYRVYEERRRREIAVLLRRMKPKDREALISPVKKQKRRVGDGNVSALSTATAAAPTVTVDEPITRNDIHKKATLRPNDDDEGDRRESVDGVPSPVHINERSIFSSSSSSSSRGSWSSDDRKRRPTQKPPSVYSPTSNTGSDSASFDRSPHHISTDDDDNNSLGDALSPSSVSSAYSSPRFVATSDQKHTQHHQGNRAATALSGGGATKKPIKNNNPPRPVSQMRVDTVASVYGVNNNNNKDKKNNVTAPHLLPPSKSKLNALLNLRRCRQEEHIKHQQQQQDKSKNAHHRTFKSRVKATQSTGLTKATPFQCADDFIRNLALTGKSSLERMPLVLDNNNNSNATSVLINSDPQQRKELIVFSDYTTPYVLNINVGGGDDDEVNNNNNNNNNNNKCWDVRSLSVLYTLLQEQTRRIPPNVRVYGIEVKSNNNNNNNNIDDANGKFIR
eukprot:PhM_4_TR4448/c0_g1_i1/m.54969